MKDFLVPLVLGALAVSSVPAPAEARRSDQDAAFEAVRSGRAQPLPMLERRILPQIQGQYMRGSEYDAQSNTYRMKFMHDGSVIWIDVDGRTGQIKRKSR